MRPSPIARIARLVGLLAAALWAAAAAAQPVAEARVIVKLKADSPLLQRAHAMSAGARQASRAQSLGQRLGVGLRGGAELSERTQVVFASGMGSAELAAKLAREADVEYAVVDRRRRRTAAPSDPRYLAGPAVDLVAQTGGPEAGQWYLRRPNATFRSAINAPAAWDLSVGSPGIVVAVVDTGARFDHPDLLPVAQGGNLLDGYDFIADTPFSNDGDGRDADARDPGDWLTQAQIDADPGLTAAGCLPEPTSSWHGTQVGGIIAATTDNDFGMASVGRTVRLLPVRVLGRCGGFDSDIVAGMRWAAGLNVPGVPDNRDPARVINLSLGGDGPCEDIYKEAVAEVNAAGAVVVASAGNGAGAAVSSPANCPGVIGVGGLRHSGPRVGYSDQGPEIAISAPAGNCINTDPGTACLYPILTLTNAGRRSPLSHASGGSAFTDSFNATLGTSFSAPLVSGTAALMLAVQPGLTADEVRRSLRASAQPFVTGGAETEPGEVIPVCPREQPDSGQCYCTTSTCGAGMLDAGAAALAATVQARIKVTPEVPGVRVPITLSATDSLLAAGRSIAAYQWTLVDGGNIVYSLNGATDGATVSAMASNPGSFTVRLRITDDQGVQSTTTRAVTVEWQTQPPPSGGGGGGAFGAGWLLALAAAAAFSSPRRSGGSRGRARRP
jgi:serine protease